MLSDDDEGSHFSKESVLYRLDDEGKAVASRKQYANLIPVRKRGFNQFRTRVCFLFPQKTIPESVVRLADPPAQGNPIEWMCPTTTDEAESMMITENFWDSVEMKQTTEQNRITGFEPGYSGTGKQRATRGAGAEDAAAAPEERSLAFYLGQGTRMALRDAGTF